MRLATTGPPADFVFPKLAIGPPADVPFDRCPSSSIEVLISFVLAMLQCSQLRACAPSCDSGFLSFFPHVRHVASVSGVYSGLLEDLISPLVTLS